MQDRFYGDNRDLVKWGTLLELARIYEAKQILQVLYYRPNEWKQIVIDGEKVDIKVDIAEEVIQHFRNVNSICNMTARTKREKPLKNTRKCLCGCRSETSSIYAPGHDAKVKGILLKIERGNLEKSCCPKTVAPFVKWFGQWKTQGFKITAAPVRIPGHDDVEYTGDKALSNMVAIEVLDKEFGNRKEYLEYVIAEIKARSTKPGIVFLDPDTGLEPPSRKSNLGHVLYDELAEIWNNLEGGDVLVLYQHKTGMNSNDFITPKLRELVNALGIDGARAKYAHAPDFNTANDVAFLYAKYDYPSN